MPAPSLPSLRERVNPGLQLGCAASTHLDPAERRLLVRHFAQVTPENCMKPQPIHPAPGRFEFADADRLVEFAEQEGLEVVGHTLCWHQQSPAWFFEPGADAHDPEYRLAEHIHELLNRYEGRVGAWDVVNEAIADHGEYLRDTPWRRALGDGYVLRAFEHARRAAPRTRLYYNDYNLELPEKRERTVRLLRELLDTGARVDGVGIQGHWMLDQVPFEHVEAAIEEYSALGLDVMFTELDLDVVLRPDCSADLDVQRAYQPSEDPYRDGCPEAVLERQATQYARLFDIFERNDAVTRVTFWGLHDGNSWLNGWPGKRTNHPLLFDRALAPKPSFWRLLERAEGRTTTS